jgi:hypothetical protein
VGPLPGPIFVIVALAWHAPAFAKSFADSLTTGFEHALSRALEASIARSLPIPAASSGLTFEYDPETGAFTRQARISGQVFLERAEPIGRHHLNVSVTYQYISTDTLDGQEIDELRDTAVPIRGTKDPDDDFTVPRFDLSLRTQQITAGVTYGVTENLELNLIVPVLYSEFGLDAAFRGAEGQQVQPPEHERASAFGVGDLLVRGKYRLPDLWFLQPALGLVLRLPTGNEDDFQGTGTTELTPLVYLSHAPVQVGPVGLQPFVNAGVNVNLDYIDTSEPRWGVGADVMLGERATVAVAVLGRHAIGRFGRPGLTDAVRTDSSVRPFLGIRFGRDDFYDFSFGGRVNLWRDTLMAFANVVVPLNDDGFRSDIIPLAGVEAAF